MFCVAATPRCRGPEPSHAICIVVLSWHWCPLNGAIWQLRWFSRRPSTFKQAVWTQCDWRVLPQILIVLVLYRQLLVAWWAHVVATCDWCARLECARACYFCLVRLKALVVLIIRVSIALHCAFRGVLAKMLRICCVLRLLVWEMILRRCGRKSILCLVATFNHAWWLQRETALDIVAVLLWNLKVLDRAKRLSFWEAMDWVQIDAVIANCEQVRRFIHFEFLSSKLAVNFYSDQESSRSSFQLNWVKF